jgi:Tfp pilus assembly protein FimT
MGWVLKKRIPIRYLNNNQKKFIYENYLQGETSGRKKTPEQITRQMKTAIDQNGNKRFTAKEFLTKRQVTTQFSKLVSKKRNHDIESYLQSVAETENDDEVIWKENDIIEDLEMTETYNLLASIETDINF